MSDQNKELPAVFMAMTGAMLILSASILWIGLGFAMALGEAGEGESNSIGNVFAIITLLNAAMFYLMGLGAIKKASKKLKSVE